MVQTIALVDDDRNILTSISIALEREGFKVQTYIDGESALIGLTKSLSKEYGRFNINSNIMELGYFDGGLADTLSHQIKNNILKKIPTKN